MPRASRRSPGPPRRPTTLGAGGLIGVSVDHGVEIREIDRPGQQPRGPDRDLPHPRHGDRAVRGAPSPRPTGDPATMSSYDPTSLEGVPQAGRSRLEQNKRGLFTSDLSVAEFLLVKEAGFDPLGLVVGSSIYHIGFQQSSWKVSEEMTRALGGDVRRARAGHDPHGGGGRPARRGRDRRRPPGGRPLRVGPGHGGVPRHRHRDPPPRGRAAPRAQRAAVHAATSPARTSGPCCAPAIARSAWSWAPASTTSPTAACCSRFKQMGTNVELPNFTQALYDARELAMERMQAEAEAVKAEGIVGVQLTRAQPRLGLARDRVLRPRHRDRPVRRGPPDRGADAGAGPILTMWAGRRT